MLDEHDLAVVVLDDIVAVEPIAVLVEIVDALSARVAFHPQDRLPHLLGLQALRIDDREGQNVHGVIAPCAEEIGRRLVGRPRILLRMPWLPGLSRRSKSVTA